MQIKFTKRFSKLYNKSPKQIQEAFSTKLDLFLKDSYNPILNNHALTGKFIGSRSINVTGDWRAIYRVFEKEKVVYFDLLGTHSQLYK